MPFFRHSSLLNEPYKTCNNVIGIKIITTIYIQLTRNYIQYQQQSV